MKKIISFGLAFFLLIVVGFATQTSQALANDDLMVIDDYGSALKITNRLLKPGGQPTTRVWIPNLETNIDAYVEFTIPEDLQGLEEMVITNKAHPALTYHTEKGNVSVRVAGVKDDFLSGKAVYTGGSSQTDPFQSRFSFSSEDLKAYKGKKIRCYTYLRMQDDIDLKALLEEEPILHEFQITIKQKNAEGELVELKGKTPAMRIFLPSLGSLPELKASLSYHDVSDQSIILANSEDRFTYCYSYKVPENINVTQNYHLETEIDQRLDILETRLTYDYGVANFLLPYFNKTELEDGGYRISLDVPREIITTFKQKTYTLEVDVVANDSSLADQSLVNVVTLRMDQGPNADKLYDEEKISKAETTVIFSQNWLAENPDEGEIEGEDEEDSINPDPEEIVVEEENTEEDTDSEEPDEVAIESEKEEKKPRKPKRDPRPHEEPEPSDEQPLPIEEKKPITYTAYFKGYPDGRLRPDESLTRAEALALILRLDNSVVKEQRYLHHKDVDHEAWYYPVLSTAYEKRLVTGYPDKSMRPNQAISRAEFVSILLKDHAPSGKPSPYSDVVNHWAKDAIALAHEKGLVAGYENGDFRPDDSLSRAETICLLNRYHMRPSYEGKEVITFKDLDASHWAYQDLMTATHSYQR